MIEEKEMEKRWKSLVDNLIAEGILRSPPVIRAMRLVPRGLFLPRKDWHYAAVDSPLPIGEGQTVSAPQG